MTDKIDLPFEKVINLGAVKPVEAIKPKDSCKKRIEELLRQLEYEIMKGYEFKELDQDKSIQYDTILPAVREDGKYNKLTLIVQCTDLFKKN